MLFNYPSGPGVIRPVLLIYDIQLCYSITLLDQELSDQLHYKHTAFSWGCYGRIPHEEKNIKLWEKNITRDKVEGDILFPECGHLP
jgi:hypothetical protein